MIVYFNTDEGDQMDLIWKYYSGETRDSFQWEYDYGLEMLYLANFSRVFLSGFMHIVPGTFVLILRWMHLIAWLLSFIALWRLVKRHFGSLWQPALVVLLLAVRPAVAYFSINLKPEPLLLLFLIIGIDYTLRITEDPRKRSNVIIAVLCASTAFIIKFAGLFLLPAIAASMFAARRYSGKAVFRELKISWIFELLVGSALIALLFISTVFYVRRSTGISFYQQFGFIGSLQQNRLFLFVFIIGVFLIAVSFMIFYLNKTGRGSKSLLLRLVNEANSYFIVISGIFITITLILGFGWILHPKYFIETYSEFGSILLGGEIVKNISIGNIAGMLAAKLSKRVIALDAVILALFLVYAVSEYVTRKRSIKGNSLPFMKRMVLVAFLMPLLPIMFSLGRFEQHNMLPFFIVISILAVQGIAIFKSADMFRKGINKVAVSVMMILLCVDIAINANSLVIARRYEFNQKDDAAYEAAKWIRNNIPATSKIVSDCYIRVYVPPEYKNIRIFDGQQPDRIKRLQEIVISYKPEYIYYNAGPNGGEAMPPIGMMLQNYETKLLMEIDSKGRKYQRKPGDRFMIYKIYYST